MTRRDLDRHPPPTRRHGWSGRQGWMRLISRNNLRALEVMLAVWGTDCISGAIAERRVADRGADPDLPRTVASLAGTLADSTISARSSSLSRSAKRSRSMFESARCPSMIAESFRQPSTSGHSTSWFELSAFLSASASVSSVFQRLPPFRDVPSSPAISNKNFHMSSK